MPLNKQLAVLLASALLALPAAASDLTLVFKTVTNGKAGTATEYMTSHRLRMSDGSSDTIIDAAAGSITHIDHGKKEYSVMTVAELEAAMQAANAQMKAAQAQAEAAMKDVPPEMRARMQQMMGGAAQPMAGLTVTAGAGTRKVAGYDTRAYVMSMGTAMQTQLWTSTALQPPMQPGEMMRLQSLLNPMMKGAGAAVDEFKKIQGLTLASRTSFSMMGRTMESSREAVEVKTTAIPAVTFALPAGYKQVPSPLLQMGR